MFMRVSEVPAFPHFFPHACGNFCGNGRGLRQGVLALARAVDLTLLHRAGDVPLGGVPAPQHPQRLDDVPGRQRLGLAARNAAWTFVSFTGFAAPAVPPLYDRTMSSV